MIHPTSDHAEKLISAETVFNFYAFACAGPSKRIPNRQAGRGGGETQDPRRHLSFLSYGRQKVWQKVGRRSWMSKWAKERLGRNPAQISWCRGRCQESAAASSPIAGLICSTCAQEVGNLESLAFMGGSVTPV